VSKPQRGLAEIEALVENPADNPAAALSQWLSGLQVDNRCLMLTTEM
jgi:hypothetical protein